MSVTTAQSIGAIMPAYNMETYLEAALHPLVTLLAAGIITELIVVDDCSTDKTAEIAAGMGARVVKMPVNLGPAAARNIGATSSASSILWFVDADVIVRPDGPAQIRLGFLERDVVAVFGSYDENPPDPGWMSQYKNLIHRFYHQSASRDAETFWAGCGAVQAIAFRAVGGFDAQTYPYPSIEDIELGYRLRKLGRILVLPRLEGTHLKSWTFLDVVKVDIFRRALPWSRLIVGREGLSNILNIRIAERARALVALALVISLIVSVFFPVFILASLFFGMLAILSNMPLFRFLRQNGGLPLALVGVLYQQIYYTYSSFVFVWCVLENKLKLRTG